MESNGLWLMDLEFLYGLMLTQDDQLYQSVLFLEHNQPIGHGTLDCKMVSAKLNKKDEVFCVPTV